MQTRVLLWLVARPDKLGCTACGQRCQISGRADGDYLYGWHCDAKFMCSGEWHAPGTERWCCTTCVNDS